MKIFQVAKTPTAYESVSLWSPLPTLPVYGGQLVAQALSAAHQTIDQFRAHSLHCFFLSPGTVDCAVTYDVHMVKQGRTFAIRRVDAVQRGRTIFTMNVSFCRVADASVQYQAYLSSIANLDFTRFEDNFTSDAHELVQRSLKYVRDCFDIEATTVDTKRFYKFLLKDKSGPRDKPDAACLIAFISDFFLIEASLVVLNADMFSVDVMTSVDHSLHFHMDMDVDEDTYFLVAECTRIVGSSACCTGIILNSKMEQVATVYQEGMVKVKV